MTRDEMMALARQFRERRQRRIDADPAISHFAAHVQRMRECQRTGQRLYDPRLMELALRESERMAPYRKAANTAMLRDE